MPKIKSRCETHRLLHYRLVVAAATENYNDSKDNNPSAVVIKDVAQAVVVHYVCLRELLRWALARLILYYAEGKNWFN